LISIPLSTSDQTSFLGGENRNIACSILESRSFSDPFGVSGPPTAWHAPGFPVVIAVLLTLSGGSFELAGLLLRGLNAALLYLTIRRLLKLPFVAARPALFLLTFFAMLSSTAWYTIVQTNDSMIQLLLLTLIFARVISSRLGASRNEDWRVLVAGVISTLFSPVLVLVWFASLPWTLASWPRRAAYAFAVCSAMAPWSVRNYIHFGQVIPVKSNLAFELKQASCDCEGGVVDSSVRSHPLSNRREALLHASMGEPDYLALQWRKWAECASSKPLKLVGDCLYRLQAVLFWRHPFYTDRSMIVSAARDLIYAAPFALVLFALITADGRRPSWYSATALLAAVYCLPYVLVSFNLRYVVPLAGLKTIFLLDAWSAIQLRYLGDRCA
tara:strand:- start:648 stop:1802 length:1155 start_codon:yes stop_codon:yes gene_type:complete